MKISLIVTRVIDPTFKFDRVRVWKDTEPLYNCVYSLTTKEARSIFGTAFIRKLLKGPAKMELTSK